MLIAGEHNILVRENCWSPKSNKIIGTAGYPAQCESNGAYSPKVFKLHHTHHTTNIQIKENKRPGCLITQINTLHMGIKILHTHKHPGQAVMLVIE